MRNRLIASVSALMLGLGGAWGQGGVPNNGGGLVPNTAPAFVGGGASGVTAGDIPVVLNSTQLKDPVALRMISVTQQGAKCDVVSASGTITSGSSTLPGVYTSADVGKYVYFPGAGTGGVPLVTTIASVAGGVATLTAPAGATSSAAHSNSNKVTVQTAQSGGGSYVPTDTITLTGGTAVTNTVLTVNTTKVNATPGIAAAGAAGTNGTVLIVGTTGTGSKFMASATISGGALTAVGAFLDSGEYTANPTSLSNEPVLAYNLNGENTTAYNTTAADSVTALGLNPLAGAQVSLVMGVKQIVLTTPGDYTATPGNPVSQGSTSGSGTGFTGNLTWVVGGGPFFYGTDDATAFNNAAAQASAVVNIGMTRIITPVGVSCALASSVLVTSNSVVFDNGTYGGDRHTVGTSVYAPTALRWFGGTSANAMLKFAPTVSGSSQKLNGGGVTGLSLFCNGVGTSGGAALGLQVLASTYSRFSYMYAEECTTAGFDFGALASLGENGGMSLTADTLRAFNIATVGVGFRINNVSGSNVNFSAFSNLYSDHANAFALKVVGADNVNFYNLHFVPASGASAYSVELTGANSFNSNSLHFWHLGAQNGLIARGEETFGASAASTYNNQIFGYDVANADPIPIQGIGATLQWNRDQGTVKGATFINGAAGGSNSEALLALQRKVTTGSMYLYNGSDGHLYLDDGTSKWRVYSDSGDQSFHVARVAGTGSILLGNDTAVGAKLMTGSTTFLTMNSGEIGMTKITASGSAPGAAGGKIDLVCGTNAGSAKLIAYAGTSSTPVTILDNIGSGVTGC